MKFTADDFLSRTIETEEVRGCLIIRFARPETRNSLSVNVLDELRQILRDASSRSFSKMIFSGTDDVFASGADLREIARLTPDDARAFSIRGQELMSAIASVRIPTVAAINGYCFGGGLDLALACRRRFASPNAVFSHPGASLGIITGWGGTQRLPHLIGEARALEMLYTAGRLNADEALEVGLIEAIADDVVDAAVVAELAPEES
jgi:enoyl-CoA hydratase/carnithine racemase